MSLLGAALGYARLAEGGAPWEQAASLRLRDGDTSVLTEYDQHARIFGGEPEQLMDPAADNHGVEAREPGRRLADGGLLRIEAVTPEGVLVRRALDADPATGRRQWTTQTFLYANCRDAELGYVVSDHVAQGRTMHTALAMFAGTEDRMYALVVLTRGTGASLSCVFTLSPKRGGQVPGPRPAPGLTRYDRCHRERAGEPGPGTARPARHTARGARPGAGV